MPANLTPEYLAAEARFREAETTEDKIAALEEMYATIPKHKGTEKMRADIKQRLSKLRNKEKQAVKHGKKHDDFHIVKQGAGQIVLIGPPNSGKSSLLDRLTGAEPEIADYPYTTRRPLPGMMEFEDILIQLVDAPPVTPGFAERAVIALARYADAVALVLDASDDAMLDHLEEIKAEMAKSRVMLVREYAECNDLAPGTAERPALIVANKIDAPNAVGNFEVLKDFYADEFPVQAVSAKTGEGLEELRRALFNVLGIIRVYTKVPGKPPDMEKPFTLKKGSTLIDLAAAIHKDFVHSLRMAKAWGKNTLDGAQIGRDHVLEDGYIVELHA
ncbi:MAG: 50S ribosome-binding GTPase [Armatimonadetes bacterium]|nr:50S ribosome-binding GTPase [Armatimonadota bacterium]